MKKVKNDFFPIVSPKPDDNMKNNEHHTLFIKQEEGESVKISPDYKRFIMYLTDFAEDSRGLHETYNVLREAGDDDILEIRISSHGGFIKEGQILHNIITEIFDGRCVTVLDPMGYSMGALAFCMGDYRLVYESSEIMFHNYSTGLWGKGNEILAHMKHTDKSIKDFFDSVVIGLTDAEKETLYAGGDFWFNAKEMCQRGIATSVSVGPHVFDAEDYLELLKRMGKEAKAKGIKKRIKTLREAQKIYEIDVVTPFIEEKMKEEAEASKESEEVNKKETKKGKTK
jgi:ATP-dependent protease ClpP protease subunit